MFIDKFLNFINQDDKDIFNFFTSLENRLYLTYYFEDIFNRNYIINFNDSNYFNKLLDIENDKLIYLIIIKGVANENDRVKLSIYDNGIGICKGDIDRVFDKFFTGINGREKVKSTGMGLYIIKKLCDKLGHNIYIESVFDEYTKVTIEFGKNDLYDI